MNRKEVGHRIRVARVENRLSQGELAERTGLNVNTISAVENGTRGMSLEVAARISDVFGWSLDRLTLREEATDAILGREVGK